MTDDTEWVDLDEVANIVHLATLNGNQPDNPVDSWTPIDLTSLPDQPPVQPTLGGTNLIYPGKRHVFSGPPESAKTLAAYAVLIQTARTGETGILIDFEMGAYDARQRLQELGAADSEISRILYLEPDERATEQRVANLIAHAPALVVIDAAAGAYSLEGLDDNRRSEVETFARLYIAAFWRNGIATILIDHVVKDKEQRGKFSIGSERKLGGTDVHLGFEPVKAISRGGSGQYKIITHKDRGGYLKRGHLCDLHLESDVDSHQIEWAVTEPEQTTDDAGYFRPTHLMEKVSIDLEHRLEPVSRNQVYEALGGTKQYVLKAIDALVREGFVGEESGPNRTKLLTSERGFREAADAPADTTSSVVRTLFDSGSANHNGGGGSGGLPAVRGRTTDHPPTDDPKPSQWFEELEAPFDPTWTDEVRPDDET